MSVSCQRMADARAARRLHRSTLLALFWMAGLPFIDARHVYTDSFPTYEEYDFSVLDPDSVYGSPYGGFSRATRSRLAALPLHLPDISDESPTDDPLYMKVRDADGRLYACRVYHEDELDPSSLEESMFDAPRLRSSDPASVDPSPKLSSAVSETRSDSRTSKKRVTSPGINSVNTLVEVELKLKQLKGICGQIHKGWWSYEWCYEMYVSQFHIEIDPTTSDVRVQDISKLGRFKTRNVQVSFDELPRNQLAEDLPELARVLDYHNVEGDICPDTNEPRKSYVHLICCAPRFIEKRRGLLHQNNMQITSDIAAVLDIREDPDHICTYNVTVCTSLLCKEEEEGAENKLAPSSSRKAKRSPKENESIREILERTLGSSCVHTLGGGWWTYELCHGSFIRQFHEVVGTARSKSGALSTSRLVESEHILGYYQPEIAESFPSSEEYRFVVNATDSEKGGGNGAYYELEYVGGDVCDHSDVTDAAIIAGSVGAGGKLERASTVRYYCGNDYELNVNEDATCHYVVEVKIPDLCNHPLFKAPVTKKQVFKCVPSDE